MIICFELIFLNLNFAFSVYRKTIEHFPLCYPKYHFHHRLHTLVHYQMWRNEIWYELTCWSKYHLIQRWIRVALEPSSMIFEPWFLLIHDTFCRNFISRNVMFMFRLISNNINSLVEQVFLALYSSRNLETTFSLNGTWDVPSYQDPAKK